MDQGSGSCFDDVILPEGEGPFSSKYFRRGLEFASSLQPLFLCRAVDCPLAKLVLEGPMDGEDLSHAMYDHALSTHDLGDDTLSIGLQHALENPKEFVRGLSIACELVLKAFALVSLDERKSLNMKWKAEHDKIARAYEEIEYEALN